MKPALSEEPMTSETFFLRTAGKSSFTALALIDQRILSRAQADIGIGIVDDLENGLRRIYADTLSPDDALVAHL